MPDLHEAQRDESDGSAPHSKPKVLLVDDHPDILKSTSRLLSFDFEIVGTASDGYQAVDAAQRLDPDVIALDITMPGRDGFETAQQLVQIGTRARIVFLTMPSPTTTCPKDSDRAGVATY